LEELKLLLEENNFKDGDSFQRKISEFRDKLESQINQNSKAKIQNYIDKHEKAFAIVTFLNANDDKNYYNINEIDYLISFLSQRHRHRDTLNKNNIIIKNDLETLEDFKAYKSAKQKEIIGLNENDIENKRNLLLDETFEIQGFIEIFDIYQVNSIKDLKLKLQEKKSNFEEAKNSNKPEYIIQSRKDSFIEICESLEKLEDFRKNISKSKNSDQTILQTTSESLEKLEDFKKTVSKSKNSDQTLLQTTSESLEKLEDFKKNVSKSKNSDQTFLQTTINEISDNVLDKGGDFSNDENEID